MPSMAYGCLFTDGKYVITCRIFIVTVRSFKTKNKTVRHDNSPSKKSVLIQELVHDKKLAVFMKIAVIKLFYIEAQRKHLC